MARADRIAVEVAYALPQEQVLIRLAVPAGSTVRRVIEQSGILQRFSNVDLATCKVGVFGRLASLDDPVKPGDRVEIYRELQADPKVARRQRAAGRKVRI